MIDRQSFQSVQDSTAISVQRQGLAWFIMRASAVEEVASAQQARSPSTADASFKIWREIFRVVVANERKALDTGAPVAFTIQVNQRVAGRQTTVLDVDLICEPNLPARELPRPRHARSRCDRAREQRDRLAQRALAKAG